MNKYQIAPIAMVVVLLGGIIAGHQLYLKERLEEYEQNAQRRDSLAQKLDQLRNTFADATGQPVDPEFVIAQWREAREPWVQAMSTRAAVFQMPVLEDVEEVPEDDVPRFFYENWMEERIQDLQQYAFQNRCAIPQTTFNAMHPQQLGGTSVTADQANRWMRRFTIGDRITRQLIDANAAQINWIELWPPRVEFGLLEKRTMGLHFYMRMDDLVAFLAELAGENRYYNVDALRIVNRNLRQPQQPYLEVQMLLTAGRILSDEELEQQQQQPQPQQFAAGGPGGGFGGPGGGFGGPGGPPPGGPGAQQQPPGGPGGPPQQQQQEESWWQRLLPFF